MAEHNFSVENTLTLLLDDKKYHSLRDILSTMNPPTLPRSSTSCPRAGFRFCFACFPRSWQRRRSSKWIPMRRRFSSAVFQTAS